MSSNQPSSSKQDPRIAEREAMVTRHKSAQMKRQLRKKDRSMKHVTDLLKSPTKEPKTATKTVSVKKKQVTPKAKQSLLKSVEKVQNLPQKTFKLSKVLRKEVLFIPDEEYHPDKLKRKLKVKKVLLKPKNAMKVVGEIAGSVKRKSAVPYRVSDKFKDLQTASPLPKMSMAEAMSIMEDHMTDEDMMEILTCPSPVWWEDPPDEDYVEDALFTRSPSETQDTTTSAEPMDVDTDAIESNTDRILLIPNLSAKSDKFLKKRSKLEDLLGNIKDKTNSKRQISKTDAFNEDVVVLCSNYRNQINNNEVISIRDSDKSRARHSESDDEIVFHNSSMNEDELLKDLENMDIPIANPSTCSDVIIIDDDEDDFLDKATNSGEEADEESKAIDDKAFFKDTVIETGSGDTTKTDNCSNEVKIPKNLPALQKCDLIKEFKDIASPKSFDSISSKSSLTSSQEMDSISDTNVRFLLDDEVDDNNKNIRTADNKMDQSNEVSNKETSKDSNKESSDNNITVYKIIEEISDTAYNELTKENNDDEIKCTAVKLNDYYKKCKKANQKRGKKDEKTDINKNVTNAFDNENYATMFCDPCKPSFKRVSDEENVKYCLNCSSIFDSKDCVYCIKKSKNRIYTCTPCKIKFCCEQYYKTHVNNNCEHSS